MKTGRGCPITQLYLETGHVPACFLLKSILDENTDSLIFKFIMAQCKNPDWVSSCLEDLKYLNIILSIEEIKVMKKKQFKTLLQKSIKNKAFQYLLQKRRSKGTEITYQSLKMAEYLAPNHENLSISDQRYIFKLRNRMIEIKNNFPNKFPKTQFF